MTSATRSDDMSTLLGVDARFPNTNQTKHCWQNYVDYHKCIIAKGEDFAPCRQVSTSPAPQVLELLELSWRRKRSQNRGPMLKQRTHTVLARLPVPVPQRMV